MKLEVGSKVKVSHPITCLNPEEFFTVVEMRTEIFPTKVWIRGENTCWFNANMIEDLVQEG